MLIELHSTHSTSIAYQDGSRRVRYALLTTVIGNSRSMVNRQRHTADVSHRELSFETQGTMRVVEIEGVDLDRGMCLNRRNISGTNL